MFYDYIHVQHTKILQISACLGQLQFHCWPPLSIYVNREIENPVTSVVCEL